MPRRPKGSGKDSAAKHTFNPSEGGGGHGSMETGSSRSQTRGPEEQDVKRRIGQFGGAGEPPLIKK
jgi:hypothetical protein